MWCPKCGMDSRVVETEKLSKTVSRVRWCRNPACRHLFETHEVLAGKKEGLALAAQTTPPAAPDTPDRLPAAQAPSG